MRLLLLITRHQSIKHKQHIYKTKNLSKSQLSVRLQPAKRNVTYIHCKALQLHITQRKIHELNINHYFEVVTSNILHITFVHYKL